MLVCKSVIYSHAGQLAPQLLITGSTDLDHEPTHLAPFSIFAPFSAGRRAREVLQRQSLGFLDPVVKYLVFLGERSDKALRLLF